MMCKFKILVIITSFFYLSCNCNSKEDVIKNTNIIPFLEEMKVDTFSINGINFPGVIYLFARNINDSVFIQSLPSECVFSLDDLTYSFFFSDKLYVCQDEIELFYPLFDFQKSKISINDTRDWKLCSEIGYLDDYDPKGISLLLNKNSIKKIYLSEDIIRKIIFGDKIPPPPPIYHDNDIYEE